MTIVLWALGLAAFFAAASVLALWSYGRFARQALGAPSHAFPVADASTEIDRLFGPATRANAGKTGLASVFDNHEAFALRAQSTHAAGRSLDMFYYIWRDDMTGRMLARALLDAADRGVRVRLLLDDVNVQGFDPKYLALNGHPGIEVRLFNPLRNRGGSIRRGLEMLLGIVRFNRRLHGKAWIADGRFALVGGRNIGDVYFDAATGRKRNTRDLDLAMAGPAVQGVEAVFDRFWNSGLAIPISALWKDHVADLPRFRRDLDAELAGPEVQAWFASGPDDAFSPTARHALTWLARRLVWTGSARVVADPPEKALGSGRDGWMPAEMRPILTSAEHSLTIVTPYFVPGREGTEDLLALAARGVRVSILTNALSATNHTIVHGAYRRYRRPLLAAGVRLFEYAPPGRDGWRGRMLHTKCCIIDDKVGFVGSFNFDLRSALLNTELGVVFEDPELVAELRQVFEHDSSPQQSYALSLRGKVLSWTTGAPERQRSFSHEPGAPALRRGTSWIIGHLPIHSQL